MVHAPAAEESGELFRNLQKLDGFAAQFIGYLASDPDQHAEHGADLVEAMIAAGSLEQGRQIARKLRDYRQTVSFYRLAEAAAEKRLPAFSQACFDEAAATQPGGRDFEREAVATARITALAARGDVDLARQELGNILSKVGRAEAGARLFKFDRDPDLLGRVGVFARTTSVAPSVRGRALLFAAEAESSSGNRDHAIELTRHGVETLCQAADVETIPAIRKAVNLFAKLGAAGEAERWAEVCLGFAERTDKRAYWKSRDLRLAAESLLDAGQQEKAAAILKQLPSFPAALDPFTYSRGAVEVAQAYLLTERKALFHEVAAHVLRMTRRHPHYRARAMAALNVLGAYLRHRQELPESVILELEASARAIEHDPHFINPA